VYFYKGYGQRGILMATKLVIWIDDEGDAGDAIASCTSNLQYDGFDIVTWDYELNAEVPKR